jgi:hypothetical protein
LRRGSRARPSAHQRRPRPAAVTFRKTILATGYDQFLLNIEPFDRTEHAEWRAPETLVPG